MGLLAIAPARIMRDKLSAVRHPPLSAEREVIVVRRFPIAVFEGLDEHPRARPLLTVVFVVEHATAPVQLISFGGNLRFVRDPD